MDVRELSGAHPHRMCVGRSFPFLFPGSLFPGHLYALMNALDKNLYETMYLT